MAGNDLSGEIIVRILGLEGGAGAPSGAAAPRPPGTSAATTPGGLFLPPGVMAPPSVSGIGGIPSSPGSKGATAASTNPFMTPEQQEALKSIKQQERWMSEFKEYQKKVLGEEEKKQTGLLSGVMAGPLKFLAGALGIGALISQSKILGTTMSTFMQLIGTLVDVFLMPLVPVLIPLLKSVADLVSKDANAMAHIMAYVRDVGWAETFKLVAIGAWAEIRDSFTVAWNETLDQWGVAFNKVVDFFLNPLKEFIAWIGSLFGKDWTFGGGTKVPLPGGQSTDVTGPSKLDKLIDKLDRLPGLDPLTRGTISGAQFVLEIYQRGADIEEANLKRRDAAERQGIPFSRPGGVVP